MLFIPIVLELVAAVVATRTFKKYKLSNEKYFFHFLWYTFLVELLALVLQNIFEINASLLYAVFTFTSFMFYFGWYYRVLERKVFKGLVVGFAILYAIIHIVAMVPGWFDGPKSYAFATGSISLLILTLLHFYQLLKSDEVLIVKHKLSFWISTALLLFYIGIIPLILLASYLDIDGGNYKTILLILNVVLYGCYIIGFLWTKKEYNRF